MSSAASYTRVLMVVTNADLAGAPSHVRDLVRRMRQKVTVGVAFGQEGPVKDALSAEGVQTFLLRGMLSRISPLTDLRNLRDLLRLIADFQPDLIHAHSSKAGMIARLAGLFTGLPVVYTVHGWGFGPGRGVLRSVLVWCSEFALAPLGARYIAVSKADARAAAKNLRLRAPRLVVIHNGVVDSEERAEPARGKGIVMVARVDRSKDHQLALSAFAGVRTDHDFELIGHETDAHDFVAKARKWAGAARGRVRYSGECTNIASRLATKAVFVLVSRYEGLPLSIIEAMRAGLPIVATDTGGVSELIESGRHGYLVPAGDMDMLRYRLQCLLDDPGLRARMGAACRQKYYEQFRVEPMCDKVLRQYDALLSAEPLTVDTLSPYTLGADTLNPDTMIRP